MTTVIFRIDSLRESAAAKELTFISAGEIVEELSEMIKLTLIKRLILRFIRAKKTEKEGD